MKRITIVTLKDKVTKLSEDALYNMLDDLYVQGKEGSDNYRLIDKELNSRNEKRHAVEEAQKLKTIQIEIERQELIQELEKITINNGKLNTMKAMVAEFGEDFKDDYHIDPDNTVRSMCETRGDSRLSDIRKWDCEDVFAAAAKVDQLIYYRVYDHFFRDGPTVEILDRLRSKIIEINGDDK